MRVVSFGLKVSRVGIGTGTRRWRLIGDGGPIMDVNVNLVLGKVELRDGCYVVLCYGRYYR